MVKISEKFLVYRQDGTALRAVCLQHSQRTAPFRTEITEIPTMQEYKLEDGSDLTSVADGRFRIVQTGEIVTR